MLGMHTYKYYKQIKHKFACLTLYWVCIAITNMNYS